MRKLPAGIASGDRDVIIMDNKQLMIIALGIIVLAVVVLAAAFFVLNDNGRTSATPTPAPTATPEPAAGATTASPAPTARPTQTVSATPGPSSPIIVQAQANKTSGICFISIYLNSVAWPVDVSRLKMVIECDGKTYADVWTLKPSDWDNSNGNSMLEPKEAIATQIDTKALGIPQGKEFTINVLQDSTVLQGISVTPT
jgi:hypothetical protein